VGFRRVAAQAGSSLLCAAFGRVATLPASLLRASTHAVLERHVQGLPVCSGSAPLTPSAPDLSVPAAALFHLRPSVAQGTPKDS